MCRDMTECSSCDPALAQEVERAFGKLHESWTFCTLPASMHDIVCEETCFEAYRRGRAEGERAPIAVVVDAKITELSAENARLQERFAKDLPIAFTHGMQEAFREIENARVAGAILLYNQTLESSELADLRAKLDAAEQVLDEYRRALDETERNHQQTRVECNAAEQQRDFLRGRIEDADHRVEGAERLMHAAEQRETRLREAGKEFMRLLVGGTGDAGEYLRAKDRFRAALAGEGK